MVYRKNPASVEALRSLAKERLSGQLGRRTKPLSPEEVQHLFEEVEIHQIELELQNEHLNTIRVQLEMALNQSNALYDFTPVGSLLVNQAGLITKLNLASANLLGRDRARLLGSSFRQCVPESARELLDALVTRVQQSAEVQDGEITLANKGVLSRHVQIRMAALPDDRGYHLVLTDITERKKNEEVLRLSEERWKFALEAAGDGVWDWNVQTGEIIFSRGFEQLFGFDENEYGHHIEDWMARIHPDDKPHMMAQTQACLEGRQVSFYDEHQGRCKDAHWKWVLCRGAIVSRNAAGQPLRMVGTHVDISSKKMHEEALLLSVRFQQAVFDSLAGQIAILDRAGLVVQSNAAWWKYAVDNEFSETPGYRSRDYLEILACMTANEVETVAAVAAGIAAVNTGELLEFQLPQPFFSPSDKRWFILKVLPVHDPEQRLVVSHEDVTRLKAAELASLSLANTDALTGALSRRHFLCLAEQELARSIRYATPLMLLMLDLDHFKGINDQHGHAAGDAVLQGFVKTVTSVLRDSDFIGRLGGEEFAVLLPNTTLEGGRSLGQRIIESVRQHPITIGHLQIAYTVSIGASCWTVETAFSELLALADAALYRAKNGGRDRLEVDS